MTFDEMYEAIGFILERNGISKDDLTYDEIKTIFDDMYAEIERALSDYGSDTREYTCAPCLINPEFMRDTIKWLELIECEEHTCSGCKYEEPGNSTIPCNTCMQWVDGYLEATNYYNKCLDMVKEE